MLLLERNHEIQVGFDSCAAVIVFAHFRWFATQSCKSCVDLSARKDSGTRIHGDDWKVRAPEMLEVCKTVRRVTRARLRSIVVDGNPGSRDVVYPIPRVGLLEERPAVSGRREKTQRGELQFQVEDDSAEGLVVKTI